MKFYWPGLFILASLLAIFGCASGGGSGDSFDGDDDDQTGDDDNYADDDDTADDDSADDDSADDDLADDDLADDDSLDPEADEDRDGISNGQEEEAGTDPRDPSDAPAWHPEWNSHPRLILDAEGWEAVKQGILSGDPDAGAIYARVISRAGRTPREQDPEIFDPGVLETNGLIARSAAFVAFVDEDEELAAKAAEICYQTVPAMDRLPPANYDKGTIQGGQALITFSQTYDLLMGFGLVDPDAAERCGAMIDELARQLYEYYVENWWFLLALIQNNHNIKLAAGFGVTGMTRNQGPEAARYLNYGITESTFFLLDWQNCAGGCQAEGPNYLDYSALSYWPFFIAYHAFAAGETYPYRVKCINRFDPGCREVNVDVVDPMDDPRLMDIQKWRLAVTMPDGYAAPFDDANLSCGYFGLSAALLDWPAGAWHYEFSEKCRHASGALDLELLAFRDRMPPPSPPEGNGTTLMDIAGQAILRDGRGARDMFALVMGENRRPRIHGHGHEHPDASSFIFFALGEMFAIDSGYIDYTQRLKVAHAWNHNLILVNGQGPPTGFFGVGCGVDAYLSELVDDDGLKQVLVKTRYRGADIERRVGLIPGDAFYTFDRIQASDVVEFRWLFHALAGGTTDGTFSLTDDGAMIDRPGAVMAVHLAAWPEGLSLEEDENNHGFSHGSPERHAVLVGRLEAQNALFLSVSAPAGSPEEAPVVEFHRETPEVLAAKISFDDHIDIIAGGMPGTLIDLPHSFTGVGHVESDADAIFLRVNGDETQPSYIHRDGGSYISFE